MKLILCLMMAGGALVMSCSKEQLPVPTDNAADEISMRAFDPGRYEIGQFILDGVDRTSEFAGYELQFLPDGSMVISTPDRTVAAAWDKAGDHLRIMLDDGDRQLAHIDNNHWQIQVMTRREIRVTDIAPAEEMSLIRTDAE